MKTKPELFTIGVYNTTEEKFFQTLRDARVDTFCDLRARRGMRGSTYAFVNSTRLQQRLQELGIHYHHFKELAPSKETRDQQKTTDAATNTAKRERAVLVPTFIEAYCKEALTGFDAEQFMEQLGPDARRIVLFCVEREPAACHRSLVAQHLAETLDLELEHLMP